MEKYITDVKVKSMVLNLARRRFEYEEVITISSLKYWNFQANTSNIYGYYNLPEQDTISCKVFFGKGFCHFEVPVKELFPL